MTIRQIVRRRTTALVGAVVAAVLTTPAMAAPPQGGPDFMAGRDPEVTKSRPASDGDEIERYWTAGKIADVHGDDYIGADTSSAIGPVLTPRPHDRLGYAEAPQPYARFHGPRETGKLAFLDDGVPSNCSGALIRSRGQSLVLTAAHCISDTETGHLVTKMVFIPEYHSGHAFAPFHEWPVAQAYLPTKFRDEAADKDSRNFNPYDIALVRLLPDAQGNTLGDLMGSSLKPVVSSEGALGNVTTFGYPATGGKRFAGAQMFGCISASEEDTSQPWTMIDAPGCSVQGGNSGGPVLNARNEVVAVTQARGTTGRGAYSVYTRLHPETFGRLLKEAEADVAAAGRPGGH